MKNPVWARAVKSSADPDRAARFLDLLMATGAAGALDKAREEHARIVAALLGGSSALGNLLVSRADWTGELEPERLKFPRHEQGLRNEVNGWLNPFLASRDYHTALDRL